VLVGKYPCSTTIWLSILFGVVRCTCMHAKVTTGLW
jgi:hypothetical protein